MTTAVNGGTSNWLDLDNNDAKRETQAKAVEFAKLYVATFIDNPAGRKILEQWTRTLARRRVPVDSTLQTYAATEAVRAFVEDINAQILLAQTEGKT